MIIPNFYHLKNSKDSVPGYIQALSDTSLRVGRVLAAYDINDGLNRNKTVPEYDISVRHANADGMVTDVVYPRVRMATLFGGMTDFFKWTPRIDRFDDSTQIGFGSRVLVLCINGSTRNAFIVGGIPHPEVQGAPVELPYTNNHHLEFQFNGVYANIDKDGTFTLIHRGATDAQNNVLDPDGGNSSIRFNKAGDIILGYNWNVPATGTPRVESNSDDLPYLFLSKQANQISLYSPDDISSSTKTKFLIETTDGVKVNPKGSDQQSWLRGSAFRDKQAVMHGNLMTQLETLATTMTTVATAITSAAGSLTTAAISLLPPVGGSTLASPSVTLAAVSLLSAGSTLAEATTTLTQMMEEIQTFEKSNGDYLSPSHFFADEP